MSFRRLWVDINRLKLLTNTTKAIFSTPVNKPLSLSAELELDGNEIKFFNAVKSFGVIFSAHLTWDDSVQYVLTKLNRNNVCF